MTANTQHQPGIRELSASDIEVVSGGGEGLKLLITISHAQSGGSDVERRSQTLHSDVSKKFSQALDAIAQNIRG
jgi:hypothetical protein